MAETRYKGDTITVRFRCIDEDGNPVSIPEGASLASDMQKTGGEKVAASSCDVEDRDGGLWLATWLPAATVNLPAGIYFFDGVTKSGAESVNTVGTGSVKIAARVTRQPV